MRFWITFASFVLFVVIAAPEAFAHPGRLNDDGCHRVTKDWRYKSGKVLKAGSTHCHRGLNKMKLDGSELLEDPKDPGEEAEGKTRRERRDRE